MKTISRLAGAGLALLGLAHGAGHAQAAGAATAAAPALHWEVQNRFPLFRSETALREQLKFSPGMSLADWSQQVLAREPELLAGFIPDYQYAGKGGCATRPAQWPTLWNPCTETYDGALFKPAATRRISVWLERPPAGRCLYRTADAVRVAACSGRVELDIPPNQAVPLEVQDLAGTYKASEALFIRDVLVLAFGDSFSSGESNPERPALRADGLTRSASDAQEPLNRLQWLDARANLKRKAGWLDKRCHRTVLSWPVLAAAKLAYDDPHTVVNMASWACTGAEITDGFFSAQIRRSEAEAAGRNVALSQFAAARSALCTRADGPPFDTVVQVGGKGRPGRARACLPEHRRRPVDAALFTFGGNDVFFAPVLMDAVAIVGTHIPLVDPMLRKLRADLVKTPAQARARILGGVDNPSDRLPVRYAALDAGLQALGVPPAKVFQVQYPNPLYEAPGRFCDKSPFDGMQVLDKIQRTSNLTRWESEQADKLMIGELKKAIEPSRPGWNVVTGHLAEVEKHGLCASFNSAEREREFAIPWLVDGEWKWGLKPSGYNHYAATMRWFRTPDDVVMGVGAGSPILPISGAFHPSAQAHAAIADAVQAALKARLGWETK